jgi:phosphoglucomutase
MDFLKKIQDAFKRKQLTSTAPQNLKRWLTNGEFHAFQDTLRAMIDRREFYQLNECFYTTIPFGTGGRRGPVGVGPNRINSRTISESVQGVANYLFKIKRPNTFLKAVIAYDTRHFSQEFAAITAEVFVGNGFKVYLFNDFRSTPELSFTVRKLKADIGVVISASHNPPADNGFKAYWSDGGQVTPPHDERIIEEVRKVKGIKRLNIDDAQRKGMLVYISEDMDKQYIKAVCQEAFVAGENNSIRIVYTPLHGTGTTNVLPVLKELGYQDILLVDEQAEPNGDFPRVKNNIPNPEDPAALELAIAKAREHRADLVLATDPDADRLGVAVPTSPKKDEWVALNGNQIASILTYYVLGQLKKKGNLYKKALVVKTLVTSELVTDICKSFGVNIKSDLPVGFKFIAQVIDRLEKSDDRGHFILGVEESHGFLKGTYARDKDAAIASALMAELTSLLKMEGKTPYQFLQELYRKYGYYKEVINPVVLEGVEGRAEILRIMEELRNNPPERVGGKEILKVRDCLKEEVLDPTMKTLESANLLIFKLSKDGKTRFSVRPSGTEPKIKYYVSVYSDVRDKTSDTDLAKIKELVDGVAMSIVEDLEATMRVGQQNVFVKKLIDFTGTKEELYDEIVRLARQVLFAEAASLFLFNNEGKKLWLRAASGYWEGKRDKCFYELDEKKLTPWIARNPGKIVKLDSNDEFLTHPAYGEKYTGGKFDDLIWSKGSQCHSFLGLTLQGPDGKVIGILKVENKRPRIGRSLVFTRDDVQLLKFISNIIVLAITKV